ncbi:MAG: hypothetical protein ABJO01_06160 [Parasphingorhabdus sp.]|uniref:hypothetical protein n=1 Tax=Parasphingorhabdus sp. TaxID=2709688 RepID=UPI0032991CC6
MTGFFRKSGPLLLIWLAVCAVLIVVSWNQIMSGVGWGPDDQLRQVQLRDWLAGQSWFDTTQYRIASPDSQPMHWSRLVEVPLALMILLLSPVVGPMLAETIAMVIIPLATLGVAMVLVAKITNYLFEPKVALLAAALTATAVPVIAQLRPMRIDHHGWQIVLALVALWTMFWPNKRKAGVVIGFALALWLSISMEGLPLSIAFVALLMGRWVISLDEGVRLFWTLTGFLVSSLIFYGINHGQFDVVRNYCDAIAPAHLLACLAGAILLLPAIKFAPQSWLVRLTALGFAGLAALGIFYTSAPQCAGSAFGELDPLVHDYWLINVREGMPIWTQPAKEIISLFGGSIIVGLGCLVYLYAKQRDAADKQNLFLLAYALIWAFAVSLLVQRAAAVAAVYALPLMGWAVHHGFRKARQIKRPVSRILATVGVVFLILPGPLALGIANAVTGSAEKETAPQSKTFGAAPACDSHESLMRLNALPPSHIIAPLDFGPEILVQTAHNILATSHHRNDAAMADHIRIFTMPPPAARDILAARNIRYIAICPEEPELKLYAHKHPDGLWAQLAADKPVAWLQPVHLRDSGLKLWRIVPKDLRNQM